MSCDCGEKDCPEIPRVTDGIDMNAYCWADGCSSRVLNGHPLGLCDEHLGEVAGAGR